MPGDLYLQSGNQALAYKYLTRAWELTTSQAEKKLIRDKLDAISN